MTALHAGRCRCGSVKFAALTEPFWRSYCHCNDCRRATGAPVTAFVGWRANECEFTGDTRKVTRLGAVERSFCSECGSPLDYRDDRLPGEIYVYLGVLDSPEDFPPTLHAFDGQRLPFMRIANELPRYNRFSVER